MKDWADSHDFKMSEAFEPLERFTDEKTAICPDCDAREVAMVDGSAICRACGWELS